MNHEEKYGPSETNLNLQGMFKKKKKKAHCNLGHHRHYPGIMNDIGNG